MKRVVLAMAVAIAAVFAASAQPRSIGGRIGYGLDVSYQHTVGRNKVTLDVGFPWFEGMSAVATHDWVIPVHSWHGRGAWNWYPGVGLGLGGRFFDHPHHDDPHNCFFIGVAGRFGFEYQFWFPMTIAVDWRPVFGIATNRYDTWFDDMGLYHLGLSLYYNF